MLAITETSPSLSRTAMCHSCMKPYIYSRRTMAPQRCPRPAPQRLWIFMSRGKGESRLQVELRLLVSWLWGGEMALGHLGRPSVIAWLKSGRGSQEREPVRWEGEKDSFQTCLEDGGRGYDLRNTGSFLKLKKERVFQKRMQLCQHLDFSPVRFTSDFCPTEL